MVFSTYAYGSSVTFFVLFGFFTFLSERKFFSEKVRDDFELFCFFAFALLVISLPVSIFAFVLDHQDAIYGTISQYWFIAPAAVAGPVLYVFRCRSPFWYGAAEVIASWVMILLAIVAPNPTSTGAAGLPLVAKITALLAGVYVSVRGLDNMDKDVPQRLRRTWRYCFRKKVVPPDTVA